MLDRFRCTSPRCSSLATMTSSHLIQTFVDESCRRTICTVLVGYREKSEIIKPALRCCSSYQQTLWIVSPVSVSEVACPEMHCMAAPRS